STRLKTRSAWTWASARRHSGLPSTATPSTSCPAFLSTAATCSTSVLRRPRAAPFGASIDSSAPWATTIRMVRVALCPAAGAAASGGRGEVAVGEVVHDQRGRVHRHLHQGGSLCVGRHGEAETGRGVLELDHQRADDAPGHTRPVFDLVDEGRAV